VNPPAGPRRARRLVAAAILLVVALSVAACSGGDAGRTADGGADPTSTTSETDPVEPEPSTTHVSSAESGCPAPVEGMADSAGPYAVGRSGYRFVDPSRRTEPPAGSDRPASAGRVLDVVALYPAEGDPGEPGSITDGAEPAPGRFPLVVYSHGVGSGGLERNDSLARWVRAGYVVLAPTFPLSSGTFDVSDLPNQPGDVAFVVQTFRSRVQDPSDLLHDRVRSACVGLAGHSLGGATSLAAALDPCCSSIDPEAVIDIAGVLLQVSAGATLEEAPVLPTLIVHGAQDATVPYAQSQRAFELLQGPRWLLTFPEGGHNSMFVEPERDVLTAAVVAFLDAELKGVPGPLEQLPELVDASGIATLQVEPAS
jgi:fermentation-respiration switch protein FrsA (DUF1100 family)